MKHRDWRQHDHRRSSVTSECGRDIVLPSKIGHAGEPDRTGTVSISLPILSNDGFLTRHADLISTEPASVVSKHCTTS